MNKIIFLDFDGVITTRDSKWEIDNEKCLLVKKICDETGAKIVISSSWRYSTVEKTIEAYKLYDWILTPYIIDVTENLSMSIGWDLLSYFPQRGLEISEYINKHNLIQNYVILDDDSDMLYIQKDHFIKTDTYKGLSEENVQQAIKILNT